MSTKHIEIGSTIHSGDSRPNNPSAGFTQGDLKPDSLITYHIDPNDSPSLNWAGKPESESFTVPATSIHRHETIYPQRLIIPALATPQQKEAQQIFMFESSPEDIYRERVRALEAYQHKDS